MMNINDLGIHPHKLTLFEPPSEHSFLVNREDISKTNQGVCQVAKRSQRKCTNMQN